VSGEPFEEPALLGGALLPSLLGPVGGLTKGLFDGGSGGRDPERPLGPLEEVLVDLDGGSATDMYILAIYMYI
jgi:hypothetical protein